MKTAIIIVAIVLLLAVFISRQIAKMGKAMQIADPLATIAKDGFLGFVLGDSFKMTWSRVMHLDLMTKDEIEDYKEEMSLKSQFGMGVNTMRVAKGKFAEIDYITLGYDGRDRLNSIMVYVKTKQGTTNREYLKEIRDKYVSVLGNPQVDAGMSYQWVFRDSSVTKFYEKDQIIIHIH